MDKEIHYFQVEMRKENVLSSLRSIHKKDHQGPAYSYTYLRSLASLKLTPASSFQIIPTSRSTNHPSYSLFLRRS